MTSPAPLTADEQFAQLKAEVASLRAEVACLTGFVGDVHKDAGLPVPGVGVTRLGRRPNPHNLRAVSGGAR